MHRKPTQVKRDADALAVRKAVQRSDPKALSELGDLPEQDTSERRLFLFYQDEGGIRGTGEDNEDLGVIYYLVRDSCLPAQRTDGARRESSIFLRPTRL